MDNEFSLAELRVVQAFISKKPQEEIAMLLDRPLEEVSALIITMTGEKDIVTYADHLNKKLEEKQKRREAAAASIEQKRKQKISAKKEDAERERLIQKQKRMRLLQEQERAKKSKELPKFNMKQIDYSQMISVRIDHKTIIYAKPGDDIEALKKNYLAARSRTSDRSLHINKSGTNK